MNVLVYGGTGSQGSAIVTALLQKGHDVTIVTRQPDNATALAGRGVKVAAGDMNDRASLSAVNEGIDAVVLTISFAIPGRAQGFAYGKNAIDAAKAAGVKLIVYNTSGPVLEQSIGNAGYDVRSDIIQYLGESGVPYIVLQPTTYMENLLGPWTVGGIVQEDVITYPAEPHSTIGWIATGDLAALVVAALERPELAPAHFIISGMENLNGIELAARFSNALGRTITYRMFPLQDFADAIDAMLGQGAGVEVLTAYTLLRDHPERVTNFTDMKPVLEKLPIQMTLLEDWVKQYAPLFTPQPVSQPS